MYVLILSLPVTFAEDNNGYHATRSFSVLTPAASGSPLAYLGGLDEQCTFNTNGSGSCVRVAINLDASTHPVFSTTTYEGTVVPWYTITSPSTSTLTPTSTPTSTPTGNTATTVTGNLAWALAAPVFVVVASYLTGVGLVARGSMMLL